MLSKTIGANVKRCRLSKKLTQEDLAHLSSVCLKSVSAIECGKANPTMDTLESIAGTLEVPPARLVAEEE